MMNLVVMALALAAAALVEAAWPGADWMAQARPPLVLGVVLYYALRRSLPLLLLAAGAGGLLTDSLSAFDLGCSGIGLAGVGLLARAYREVVFSGEWLTHMVFGALAGMALVLALYLVLCLADSGGVRALAPGWVLVKALGTGAFGLAVAPAACWAMDALERRVGNLRMESAP